MANADQDRSRALYQAITDGMQKHADAKKKKKKKRSISKPWIVFRDEWYEALYRRYGKDWAIPIWSGQDQSLAKKLIGKVGVEAALRMLKSFVEDWDRGGKPSMGYFWRVQDSIHAVVITGRAPKEEEWEKVMREAEFNAESADKLPDFGW